MFKTDVHHLSIVNLKKYKIISIFSLHFFFNFTKVKAKLQYKRKVLCNFGEGPANNQKWFTKFCVEIIELNNA